MYQSDSTYGHQSYDQNHHEYTKVPSERPFSEDTFQSEKENLSTKINDHKCRGSTYM